MAQTGESMYAKDAGPKVKVDGLWPSLYTQYVDNPCEGDCTKQEKGKARLVVHDRLYTC